MKRNYRHENLENTDKNEKDLDLKTNLHQNNPRSKRPTYLKNYNKRVKRPKTSHYKALKQNRPFSSKLKFFPKLRPKSVLLKKNRAKVFVRLTMLLILHLYKLKRTFKFFKRKLLYLLTLIF